MLSHDMILSCTFQVTILQLVDFAVIETGAYLIFVEMIVHSY